MCAIPASKHVDYEAYIKLSHIVGMPFGVAMLKTKTMAVIHVIFYCLTVESKMESSVAAVKVFTIFQGIRAIMTLIMVLNRNTYRNAQVEVVSMTFDIEKRFLDLGIADNYQKKIIATILLQGGHLLISISLAVYAYYGSTIFSLWETIDSVYGLAILDVPFLIHIDWMHHIIYKLDRLKQMLTNIRHNCTESAHNATAIEVFLVVSRNYEDTYQVVAKLTDMYSFDTALILFLDMNQALLLATILYQGIGTVKHLLTVFGISVRLLIWLIETKWIETKPKQLAPILGESEICYSSYELSSAKNTFLVQLLHEKIAIDYYGYMQMNASFLLNHSNQAMSLLIFLYQLINNLSMEK